jgi:hypothetical protein
MSTVILTSILPFAADGSWLLTGTVDGNAHSMRWDKPFNPTELTPASVAQSFMNDWAMMDQLINYLVASRSINIAVPRQTTPVAVTFGNKATCYALVGFDQVKITGSISATPYHAMFRFRDLLEMAYANPLMVLNTIAQKIVDDWIRDASWLEPYVTTFTGVTSTTSSSTTSTSTTTTTTTTTTTSSSS